MGRQSLATLSLLGGLVSFTAATGCPYMDGGASLHARAEGDGQSQDILADYKVDDSTGYFTDDVGGRITEQQSLKAGKRGPTLLEDYVFRQKITHFDHERVPERAVHARGAGAHGTFTSYADWSNLTAASFLGAEGKETPMFVRFSTVAGSRGSADTARDVHGFATRFYTDEGNFDIVGNNIPVFFIQDAIQFPDLIHSVKPNAQNEIPQAATAHDSAWDFFSQQPSTLHTLFWAMAGYGIPRGLRHMDGHGVHTYRLVTAEGDSKLIKWNWKSKQGKASLLWEEAQALAGKNADWHRQDLFDAIEAGNGPEWELGVQVIEEDQALAFGFDVLDPTKIIPEEYAPIKPLGIMKLDRNPTNYFAETEQVMFQPGHIVRGVDFTEDPLLQGRIFSYLDTQLNRNGGPNFEQLPINRPVVPIHNNNRDGMGQMFVHTNSNPYSPNTQNKGYPKQASQKEGNGFFTAPIRSVSGGLNRELSDTFKDNWSQPRLFYNSLTPVEQQFLINAIRFETSHLTSTVVKENVLSQLNLISHDIASRVATALGMTAPEPDDTYYHSNTTAGISITNSTLPTVKGMKVAILSSNSNNSSSSTVDIPSLKSSLESAGLTVSVVGETIADGIDKTYSAADAVDADALIITSTAQDAGLFSPMTSTKQKSSSSGSSLYPPMRPLQIAGQSYLYGKPVAFYGSGEPDAMLQGMGYVADEEGVYIEESDADKLTDSIVEGLKTFKFTGRFALD